MPEQERPPLRNRFREAVLKNSRQYLPVTILRMTIKETGFPRLYRWEAAQYQYSRFLVVHRRNRVDYVAVHNIFTSPALILRINEPPYRQTRVHDNADKAVNDPQIDTNG